MPQRKVRFAVVGVGNIAQMAVLPAFEHADGCELVALVSSDEAKRAEVGRRYNVRSTGPYDELERVLDSAQVEAAYIALPNTQHREFTERCARAGVHVLCEKPMATTAADCEAMIDACARSRVLLMIAYRLHFDPASLHAIEIAQAGTIGQPRFFSSTFGQQVKENDIRTQAELGGGALFDMGIYCVNAARNLFRDEPTKVMGLQAKGHDPRFESVDEMTTAILEFPGNRLAQISASQGSAEVEEYRIVGSRGDLRVEPAYTYFGELAHHWTVDGKTKTKKFRKSDQFAPELLHFARCIHDGIEPEPSGAEGLADVRVLEAIAESARTSRAVELPPFARTRRPGRDLEAHKPPVSKPKVVHAPQPTK
jgi:predicted dehydrogenase